MKKIYTKMLILSILCTIITLFLCSLSIKIDSFDFSLTKDVVDGVNDMGNDNPGAGWYFLMAGGAALMADFAISFAVILFVLLAPGFMFFLIIISQAISRLVQVGENKEWKNTTSKVFACIAIILQILICTILLFNILSPLTVNKVFLSVALVLNIGCVFLFIIELKHAQDILKNSSS